MERRRLLLALAVCVALLVAGGAAHSSHRDQDYLFSSRSSIRIPGIVHVGCIGFGGDGGFQYTLKHQEYQTYLESLYKYILPSLDPDDEDFVKFVVRYRADPLTAPLAPLEELIATQIAAALREGKLEAGVAALTVSDDIKEFFEGVYQAAYAAQAGWSKNRYVALLLNPSFARIKAAAAVLVSKEADDIKRAAEKMYGYTWVVHGVPTSAWVGSGSVAVMDVTADSVYVGPSDSPFGTRSPLSIPTLSEFMAGDESFVPLSMRGNKRGVEERRNVLFEAALAGALHSLVAHVFFPDVSFAPPAGAGHWNQIYVPIMVFKNHGGPVPLAKLPLHRELRKVFHRSISLDVKFGTHSLHDHKHVSMAVSKALRTRLVHELNDKGLYEARGIQYLDSKLLAVELRRSADALAGIMLEKAPPSGVQNQKTLPVYVISLHDLDPQLLFENQGLLAVEADMVLVLHTPEEEIPAPLIIDMNGVTLNATDPTCRIVAGVAENQGLTPPFRRYSPLHGREELDYTWAIGNHPFGPFAESEVLSPMMVGNIRRNAVLSRVYQGVALIRHAMADIDMFAERYMHGAVEDGQSVSSWLEAAYHGKRPESDPLMYTGAVERLHTEISALADQLDIISQHLLKMENDKAFEPAQSFLYGSTVLKKFCDDELSLERIRLQCCNIHHIPSSSVVFYSTVALALSFIAVMLPAFFVVFYWFYRSRNSTRTARTRTIQPRGLLPSK